MTTPLSVQWRPLREGQPVPGYIRILDQTRLPLEVSYVDTTDLQTVWTAIKTLQVRGAPAIGVTAAMGVAAAAQTAWQTGRPVPPAALQAADTLATSRPTAVNLFWALDRMRRTVSSHATLPAESLVSRLVAEASAIRDEDAAMCRAIGEQGATLLHDGDTILTHCNAGSLATAEFGTALAPVYVAQQQGKHIRVFADETRPLLQGARLTAWELMQAGVDVTLICDNMAAHVMRHKGVKAVLVGADRIAANGDTANKIGTYGVAVLARAHHIPFYVLAPTSTMDLATATGADIPIEERGGIEITEGFGRRTAPEGVKTHCPAFDVTPAELIAAIVCEKGILRPPFDSAIRRSLSASPGA